MANDRNPLIIPAPEKRAGGCPHCRGYDFSGRMISGVLVSTCRSCGGKWQGGLPQVPQDPRIPLPPEDYVPTVRFGRDSKGEPVELLRRPDPTPAFRKGAPIPSGDE